MSNIQDKGQEVKRRGLFGSRQPILPDEPTHNNIFSHIQDMTEVQTDMNFDLIGQRGGRNSIKEERQRQNKSSSNSDGSDPKNQSTQEEGSFNA